MAVKMWEDVMAVDPQLSEARHAKDAIREAAEETYRAMGLMLPRKNRWFQHH